MRHEPFELWYPMKQKLVGKLRFLSGFAMFLGGLWFLWDTPLIYPLKIFVVLLHEISHGIVALATGGSIKGSPWMQNREVHVIAMVATHF